MIDTSSIYLINLLENWDQIAEQLGSKVKRPESIKTETALIYDAVKLLATALQDLDQSQSIDVSPVSCENGVPWPHGSSLINYMRPVSLTLNLKRRI